MDRRWKPLPLPLRPVSMVVPLRTARCRQCRRPRMSVSWRRVPLRMSLGLCLFASLFAFDYLQHNDGWAHRLVSREPSQLAQGAAPNSEAAQVGAVSDTKSSASQN